MNERSKDKSINRLNNLFGVAEEIVTEIESKPELNLTHIQQQEVTEALDKDNDELYSLKELKQDFIDAKNSLKGTISVCENLMGDIEIDFHALTASQVDAISSLGTAITKQVKTLMELYKDLKDFEKETEVKSEVKIENQNVFNISTVDIIDEILTKKESKTVNP